MICSKREFSISTAVCFMIMLSSCATDQNRRASAEQDRGASVDGPIHSYIGMSRVELEQSLGRADDETEISDTMWFYYDSLRATFGVSKRSDTVVAGVYPTVDANSRVDASRPDLGYGLEQGMTKDQVEKLLGRPSRTAPLAWTYCELKGIGAHQTPTFITFEFKYVHANSSLLNNLRVDDRCAANAQGS